MVSLVFFSASTVRERRAPLTFSPFHVWRFAVPDWRAWRLPKLHWAPSGQSECISGHRAVLGWRPDFPPLVRNTNQRLPASRTIATRFSLRSYLKSPMECLIQRGRIGRIGRITSYYFLFIIDHLPLFPRYYYYYYSRPSPPSDFYSLR